MSKIYRGRPLLVHGHDIYYGIKSKIWLLRDGKTTDFAKSAGSSIWNLAPRLVDRLFRNEISHLKPLPCGGHLIVYRKDFIYLNAKTCRMDKVWTLPRGSRPLGVSTENNGWIVFGEYGSLDRHSPVHIYAAHCPLFDFKVVHSFAPGEVKHVHNVIWDAFEQCYWVLVGDSDEESGILRLEHDFSDARWLVRGGQMTRAVNIFVRKEDLIFGTDSERASNHIVRIEKATGKIQKLIPVVGSSLHCAYMSGRFFVSTAVEPSGVNLTRLSSLYSSTDGYEWHHDLSYQKDIWHPTYFQFGTIVLPHTIDARHVVIGGQAISGLDGYFSIID